jgi:NAD+ diphosphatase
MRVTDGKASEVKDRARAMRFAGGTLDRADPLRGDPVRLAAAFASPAARHMPLDGLLPMVDGAAIVTAPLPAEADMNDYILLGLDDDAPLFVALPTQKPPHGAANTGVWQACASLGMDALAHYGAARSMVDWHARHGFCATCGTATRPIRAGWSRQCGGCNAEHFPRVDPVVIMLAEYRDRVLVGRQPRFPPRNYSALAGFLEPGETVEEAVARELWEEAGVRTTSVRYVMSQPWPFPSSLMMACIAPVESDALTIDTTELEDAIWIDRDTARQALDGAPDAPFNAPAPVAIAHHLLRHWVES